MSNPRNNLTGMVFGLLTVVSQADDYIGKDGKARTRWKCICECGRRVDVLSYNLKRGNSRSCGKCGVIKSAALSKHAGRHTRLYSIWTGMKTRCYDQNNESYVNYGARGITMCDEWRTDFASFRDWALSNGYSEILTIDRADNDGNYCPENCRWVDAKVQANNRRSSKYVSVGGKSMSLAAWADLLGYSRSIFHARAKLYHTTVEEQVRILASNRNIA